MSNIEESNSAIALFLGAIEDYWEAEDRFEDTDEDSLYLNFEEVSDEYLPPLEDYSDWVIPIEELKYHESWAWLLPVVQKINNPYTDTKRNYKIKIENASCLIYHYAYGWEHIWTFDFTIEGIYQAVVETIKLINNEKI